MHSQFVLATFGRYIFFHFLGQMSCNITRSPMSSADLVPSHVLVWLLFGRANEQCKNRHYTQLRLFCVYFACFFCVCRRDEYPLHFEFFVCELRKHPSNAFCDFTVLTRRPTNKNDDVFFFTFLAAL